ncbi:MAG: class I SAM-dependent RNA methyltransferase, partial [Deltaproteobacteria bacterium]|nr:class I SAM-dependent RNA methyltransferase [Deltaproteobacteria bacterium]
MSRKKTAGQLIGPLRIDALVNGGNGIAREQGRVIFVPGAFPGDVVLCRLRKEKKNFAEGEVVELLQASPLRREPLCPVAEECGGCQWQQLPYAEQLRWKQQLFTDTLRRQAGVDPQLLQPIVPAADEWGYRSRAQLKCSHSAGRLISGFYRSRSRSVVEIDQCPLLA